MLRRAVIAGILVVGAFQPVVADDFKFRVTSSKDFELVLTIVGGPLMLLDACWSKGGIDLDWVVLCDYPSGIDIAAVGASTEEKCEDLQVGIFGGNAGIVCSVTLFSNGGTGKGQGALRFTGTEFLDAQRSKAVPMSIDELPHFRARIEEFKAKSRQRKRAN